MNNKKTLMIIAAVEALVAAFMYIAVTKIAPVCGGMLELASGKQVHMKCHYAGVVFVFIAVVLLINAVVAMIAKPSVVSGVMTIVVALLVFAVLNESVGIGVCANTEMACQMTVPYAKVCATIEVICGAAYAFVAKKADK